MKENFTSSYSDALYEAIKNYDPTSPESEKKLDALISMNMNAEYLQLPDLLDKSFTRRIELVIPCLKTPAGGDYCYVTANSDYRVAAIMNGNVEAYDRVNQVLPQPSFLEEENINITLTYSASSSGERRYCLKLNGRNDTEVSFGRGGTIVGSYGMSINIIGRFNQNANRPYPLKDTSQGIFFEKVYSLKIPELHVAILQNKSVAEKILTEKEGLITQNEWWFVAKETEGENFFSFTPLSLLLAEEVVDLPLLQLLLEKTDAECIDSECLTDYIKYAKHLNVDVICCLISAVAPLPQEVELLISRFENFPDEELSIRNCINVMGEHFPNAVKMVSWESARSLEGIFFSDLLDLGLSYTVENLKEYAELCKEGLGTFQDLLIQGTLVSHFPEPKVVLSEEDAYFNMLYSFYWIRQVEDHYYTSGSYVGIGELMGGAHIDKSFISSYFEVQVRKAALSWDRGDKDNSSFFGLLKLVAKIRTCCFEGEERETFTLSFYYSLMSLTGKISSDENISQEDKAFFARLIKDGVPTAQYQEDRYSGVFWVAQRLKLLKQEKKEIMACVGRDQETEVQEDSSYTV